MARKPGSLHFPCLGYGVSVPRPKTVFTNLACSPSEVWLRAIRDSFPLSSEAPAFTSILCCRRKTLDPAVARECQRALGQKIRSIGTSARRQILNFTCVGQPM